MKIATAAYPAEWLADWDAYTAKLTRWCEEAASHGADLMVFPEYGAMELASIAGEAVAADIARASVAVSDMMPRVWELHADLARRLGVHILAASAPVVRGDSLVNRAALVTPEGQIGFQDKQIMTRFERDDWAVSGGGPLQVFDTSLGKIGILICYDCEFPLLARALVEAGVELLLVPSCTEALEGYWRVRIGAMARALEGQCACVMASLTGGDARIAGIEEQVGMGAIFTPPDRGMPPSGVSAQGRIGTDGWTYGKVSLPALCELRRDGNVLGLKHWVEQTDRLAITQVSLR
ncbi:amidohydrolase [Litorivita pollutaquae]|uniref:Amidohydrolase n=1 Tax=Litorivita pollutaquae TaxID=2200892 RepID=A0A2V4NJW4_9RHOB|nr:carbon-nitrogen hydrolase family protein [Litorivita pollutaquae]PYC46447.1 amidohydrolase [Litorivita pollutaquae]